MFDRLKGWIGRLFPANPADPNVQPTDPSAPAVPNPNHVPITIGPAWVGYIKWAIWIAGTVGTIATFVLAWQQTGKLPAVPVIPPIPQHADEPMAGATGWHGDAEVVAAARSQVTTVFRSTPAGSDNDPLPPNVFQWQIHEKVTGQKTPLKDQGQTGDCVGFGSTTGYERALVCAIAAGADFDFTYFAEEATYAASRVDIGGGQMRGQDGSVGGWAAKAQTDIGMLPKAKYPDDDFTTYDEAKARRLGDVGLTAGEKGEMAKYKAGAVANLKTTVDLRKALANGAGAYVCTARGYAAQRDQNGVCRREGGWGHCLCSDGYATVNGKIQYHLDNSWDSMYHKGPTGPGDPSVAGFYVVESEMAAILAEGDSWAVSAVRGFPRQRRGLDWFVDARPLLGERRDRLADLFAFALAP